ncbi:MAG: 2,3,4,5-tetrahydropyridine-2,6-dicarboxylate N-succinyltransferase [Patescibacteria group bacterium]
MFRDLQATIEQAWSVRDDLSPKTHGPVRDAVNETLKALDSGTLRVAERNLDGARTVNQWAKQAVLLSFRLNPNQVMGSDPYHHSDDRQAPGPYYDKVASKFAGWGPAHFEAAGFRVVPGSIVRHGAYIGKDVVLMPSFVNVGAYIDEGTMIDTWATVGSCAQIGKKCHISGGAGIGGVLEPLQAAPVIIEDNCFIGARSEVAEGVIVREGSVLAMGVLIGASTPIIDRATSKQYMGEVPPYSVVVPGNRPTVAGRPSTYCAVIVKQVDEQTRSKTSINELLRT